MKDKGLILNGYYYTKSEIFEALMEKGYLLIRHQYRYVESAFMGGYEEHTIDTYCALKGADLPSEKNLWGNVAIREFQKELVKPKLV